MKSLLLLILWTVPFFGFSQPPINGLIAHYSFSGNTDDDSGNNFNASNVGATLTTDRVGLPNSAYLLDGVDDYLELPSDSQLHPDFPFSVSLWFQVDVLNSGGVNLLASDELDNAYSGFTIGYIPSGKITVGYGDGLGSATGNRFTKESIASISTGVWHNVVAVFNGLNDVDLYIDCQLDQGTISGSASSMNLGTSNGVIGKNVSASTDTYHNGKIDDIRIYDYAVTSSDIEELCNEDPTLSLNDNSLNFNFTVYPNPASDYFVLEFDSSDKSNLSYEVVEVNGRLLKRGEINELKTTIETDAHKKGSAYFVNILNEVGQIIQTRKVVVR